MKEQLEKYLIRYSDFDTLEIETIYNRCHIKTYKKKDFLLKQNSICKYNFFILKGLVRQFRVEDNGNENVGFPKNRTVHNSNLLILNSNCHNEKQQV